MDLSSHSRRDKTRAKRFSIRISSKGRRKNGSIVAIGALGCVHGGDFARGRNAARVFFEGLAVLLFVGVAAAESGNILDLSCVSNSNL